MEREFILMIFIYIFTSLIIILAMSGIDLHLDLSGSNTYGSAFTMNAIVAVLSSILAPIIVTLNLPFIKSRSTETIILRFTALFLICIIKYLFLYLFDFEFKIYTLILLLESFTFMLAPYIIYKMLAKFGSAFTH